MAKYNVTKFHVLLKHEESHELISIKNAGIESEAIESMNRMCVYIYIEKEYVPSSPMIAIGIIKPPLRYWPPFGSLEPRVFSGLAMSQP